jgi:tetratricopeptide (TPR) repeat protein
LKPALVRLALGLLLLGAGCASSERFLWEEYTGLGVASIAAGEYRNAEQFLNRALVKAGDLGPTEQGITFNGLGELYRRQRRYEEAERMFTRSLELKESALGRDHPDVATTLVNLGLVHLAEGRNAEALPLLERALTIQETASVKRETLARTLTALTETYRRLGQEDKARETDERRRLLPEAPRR